PWPLAVDVRGGATATSFPLVAVLPLSNLSGDPKRDYFGDGVTEDIIDALGRFSGVRVMSRNAVRGFKGKSPIAQAIRSELGARYIVQGSVREGDGKLRVAIELSDAEKGVQLWSERYDGEGAQLFEIQDRIVKNIVGSLQVKLTRLEQQRAFTKPTESLEAYDLVLRARSLIDLDERSANREARSLLARAQKLAPDYAEVLTALGEAEWRRAAYGWIEDPPEGIRRAEAFGKRALASADPRAYPRAHSLLATLYTHEGRPEDALVHTERAIAMNPSDASALFRHGHALLTIGKVEEAIVATETAMRFEPRPSPGVPTQLATMYYTAGRYRDALAHADEALARFPNHVGLHAIRAAALGQVGNSDEARKAADQVRRFNPTFQVEDAGTRFKNPEHADKLREGLRKAGL
ncbi:MAG: tetratricopeptide repeat protein, partial [Burkholderiales bacterium]